MVDYTRLNYVSLETIYIQRLSVILSELVLVFALQKFIASHATDQTRTAYSLALCVFFCPGFIIIDNIHFQYNGMLFGILVWSFVFMKERKYLASAAAFTSLLCFKHIFLYLAPAYFIMLLRVYCLPKSLYPFSIKYMNIMKLGVIVMGIFVVAFAPFVYLGQISQLLTRLFPFSRGLCHAYWAPNFWAIYSFADRLLLMSSKQFPWLISSTKEVLSPTAGLVRESTFAVLPDIPPKLTFMLTLFYQSQALLVLFFRPSYERFLGAVTLCAYASFLFGWHVHEKAILLVMVPFTFLAVKDRRFLVPFKTLAGAGSVSLFPLLITTPEAPIKYIYTLTWFFAFSVVFDGLAPVSPAKRIFLLDRISEIYLIGFIPLYLFAAGSRQLGLFEKYEFLELMTVSIYCSLGVIGSWTGMSWLYFFGNW